MRPMTQMMTYIAGKMPYARIAVIGSLGFLAACASTPREERFADFLERNDVAFNTSINSCVDDLVGKPVSSQVRQAARFYEEQAQRKYGVEPDPTIDDVAKYCIYGTVAEFDKQFTRLEREALERFRRDSLTRMNRFDSARRNDAFNRVTSRIK